MGIANRSGRSVRNRSPRQARVPSFGYTASGIRRAARKGDLLKRIQFEINDTQHKMLDDLMKVTGISTKTEFLNNAFTLLEWAIEERRAGRIIASVDLAAN